MDINGVLTIIGLAVAVYTVLPQERQKELVLRVQPLDKLMIGGVFAAVHVLLYFEYLRPYLRLPGWGETILGRAGLSAQDLSYLIVLFVSFVLVWRLMHFRLKAGNLKALGAFVDEAIARKEFSALATILEEQLDCLVRISEKHFLSARIRRMFEPDGFLDFIENRKHFAFPAWLRWVTKIFPDSEANKVLADQVIRVALSNKSFIRWCSENRPYLVLPILRLGRLTGESFVELFFQMQLGDPTSILYSELKNNQNLSAAHRYEFPSGNRLLFNTVGQPKEAERVQIWRPIGEKMLSTLSELRKRPKADEYNLPLEDYADNGRWESPLSMGIFFFDLMVSEAIYQGVQWHMWLYYMSHVTDRICANYVPDESADLTREFPTKYSYVLYEISSALRDWISIVEELPEDQPNAILRSVVPNHENGNPIKSSMIAFAQHVRSVLTCPRIPERFKVELAEQAFRTYVDLLKLRRGPQYAEAFLNVLLLGGNYERGEDSIFLGTLVAASVDWDPVLFNDDGARLLLPALIRAFERKHGREALSNHIAFTDNATGITILRDGGGRLDVNLEDSDPQEA